MSAAMTASSASNHRQYFTYLGYSALHNSERCFPERYINGFYLTLPKKKERKYCRRNTNIGDFGVEFVCFAALVPVLTPRFAAKDWIMSAKINPMSTTHSSCKLQISQTCVNFPLVLNKRTLRSILCFQIVI